MFRLLATLEMMGFVERTDGGREFRLGMAVLRLGFDYLASLEWIRATENVCMIGPAGTGKSHTLIALGIAAVQAGHRLRYFTAADLVETLYRGLADNSVGKVIDTLLRNDLVLVDELGFAPLDDTGAQLLFRFVAAAYERRSLGIASHWPFESWGRFLPEHTTAVSMLDRLLLGSVAERLVRACSVPVLVVEPAAAR